jgi:hypothetical protein
MNLHAAVVPPFAKTLRNLERWLDKAAEFAQARKFEADTLLTARLAPDQFPLVKQVQAAADQAKLGAARLAGVEAPKHADTETTFAELRERLRATVAWLESLTPAQFEGAEERTISLPWWQGKTMRGGDYLDHYLVPNFYFHATHCYALLRHNGVELGKVDFLMPLPLQG